MIINLKIALLDYDGSPLQISVSTESKQTEDFTLGEALMRCINLGGEQDESGNKKLTRFRLSMRIQAAIDGDGQLTLTSKEIVLLAESAVSVFPVITYGRIVEIIDPAQLEDKEE